MNKRTIQLWIILLISVLSVQLNRVSAKKNSEEIIVINNTGGGGCGSGAKTIVKTDGGKKKKKGGHSIILMAGGGGKCGEKHHHHTKVVHVPYPVPVPVPVKHHHHEDHHEKHDHWASSSNHHDDHWASASSNDEIKPHHKSVKVSSATVPPHRPSGIGHMMSRMEKQQAEQKSTLLHTLLNGNEKANRSDKKSSTTKSSTDSKKKGTSSEKDQKEAKDKKLSPQLIAHDLVDPNHQNVPPEFMPPPPPGFGLMLPEAMQSAMMNPNQFMPAIPMPNEMQQQFAAQSQQQQPTLEQQQQLHDAIQQQIQMQQQFAAQAQQQQQQPTLEQQQQIQMQQQYAAQSQQQQPTLEQQQQLHDAIQQQIQIQQQLQQHLQNEHQKMQEAMASSVPQPLSQDSPLASQLPIPLPGQSLSAPVFEPINLNETQQQSPNIIPQQMQSQFNELEIIPYEVQQQLQAAGHLSNGGRENTLMNTLHGKEYGKDDLHDLHSYKDSKMSKKNKKNELIHKDHPLDVSSSNAVLDAAISVLPPPHLQSNHLRQADHNLDANQMLQPTHLHHHLINQPPEMQMLPLHYDAQNKLASQQQQQFAHSFMMVNENNKDKFSNPDLNQQQTIQIPILIAEPTESQPEKMTVKRFKI